MSDRLQYISQGATAADQLQHISRALDGGCRWIQLRFKNAEPEQIIALGAQVKIQCAIYGATLIINDHPLVAKALDAGGVHLGLTDMPVAVAKKMLGPGKIIGGTANTLEDVLRRAAEGCSYVGLGPFRYTPTKERLSPILGMDGYRAILTGLRERGILIPIYAIGGIIPGDLPGLLDAGVYGAAVSGLITHHADSRKAIAQLNTHLYAAIDHS